MPLVQTRGAASAQGFGEFAQVTAANYIEEVFSCFLYTGNGSTQTITNGIDLSTKGGLVWSKDRTSTNFHSLEDTVRGVGIDLTTNSTGANFAAGGITSFNNNGYSIDSFSRWNQNTLNFVNWTFRKQPKFFDVLTYTGTGVARTVAHNLGSVPGCIIVKRTDTTGAWQVYHRSLANTEYLVLNTTAVKATGATWWNSTTPTSSVFSVGTEASVNDSGGTYVAYVFAHDAGGFGLTGTDNVISCGAVTTDGSGNATVSLGYEPQWLMVKDTTNAQNWYIEDNMRAFNLTGRAILFPSLPNAEATGATAYLAPNSTGFAAVNGQLNASATYIYIAIRRGPMKVPTDATKVFSPVADTGTSAAKSISAGFTVDAGIRIDRQKLAWSPNTMYDKLQGALVYMNTNATTDNIDFTPFFTSFDQAGITVTNSGFNSNTTTYINYFFQRAPNFFDEVCYTGTGIATTLTHNLNVAPELIIVKRRSASAAWDSYSSALANTEYVVLNTTAAKATGATRWNSTTPTSSVFSVGTSTTTNASAGTYVAYLFATCAGVSKVGSYTGTGTTLQINCGFTAGSRFVLIKRTDSTGDWYVWDSARGIVSGNDPYLLLNSTAAEVTNTDYIDTYSAGFEISSTAPAAINASAGTFIFLAIA